jgi:hypothetical protein
VPVASLSKLGKGDSGGVLETAGVDNAVSTLASSSVYENTKATRFFISISPIDLLPGEGHTIELIGVRVTLRLKHRGGPPCGVAPIGS